MRYKTAAASLAAHADWERTDQRLGHAVQLNRADTPRSITVCTAQAQIPARHYLCDLEATWLQSLRP